MHAHYGLSRRRRGRNFWPIFIAAFLIFSVGFSFAAIQKFFSTETGQIRQAYLFSTGNSRAEVQLSGNENFNEVFNVSLQEGDTVRSKFSRGVEVEFFEKTKIRFDEKTELKLEKIRQISPVENLIAVKLVSGRVWIETSPRTDFQISNSEEIRAQTDGGNFAFGKELIVLNGDKVILSSAENSVKIYPGQFLSKFSAANLPTGKMISEEIRTGDWFRFGLKLPFESEKTPTNLISIETPEPRENLTRDDFQIFAPTTTEKFSTFKKEIFVKGTAPKNAAKIVVDEFELGFFKPGDENWIFKISDSIGNRVSKNFVARAFDADEKLIAEDSIFIDFQDLKKPKKVVEEIPVEVPEFKIDPQKPEISTDADEFLIVGPADPDATKIVVNNFELNLFESGDEEFFYRIASRLKNRGRKNSQKKYKIEQFDAAGEVLKTYEVVVDFE